MTTDLQNMSHNQLIIAEYEARKSGDTARAETIQRIRWNRAMGSVINTENTKKGV